MGKIVAEYYATSSGKKPVYEQVCSLDVRTRQKFFDVVELRFSGVEGAVRVLYFFFHRHSAVLTNSFLQKTQKTPANEIDLAIAR